MGDSEGGGTRYNLRSPSVKRLMQESKELREATEQYHAQPLDDNLYEWHFTIRGAPDTDFADGVYHGRIMLPAEYPMKPPSIVLLTPNGRFEVNKKICLSISGHHPESWQPSWSIRTALMAIIGFLPSPGKGAIGALDYPAEERKKLAKRSKEWKCPVCNVENHQLLRASASSASSTEERDELMQEFKDLARKISFKGESSSESSSGDSAAKKLETPVRKDSKEVAENVGAGNVGSKQDSEEGAAEASTPQLDSPISPSKDSVFEVGAAATANTPPPAPLTAAFPPDESVASSSTNSSSTNDSADVAHNNDADGLRRRTARLEDVAAREVAAREAAAVAAAPVTSASTPTIVPQRAPTASASSSYYLMILVSVAIVVLLLRRILRLVDFKFDFQFDYQFERH